LPYRDYNNTGYKASPDFISIFPNGNSSLVYIPSSYSSNSPVYIPSSYSSNSLAYIPSSYSSNSPVYSLGNYRGNILAGPGNQIPAIALPSLALNREPTLIDIDYYSSNTLVRPGNQILAIAIPSPALTREPTLIDTDYYTIFPGPSPPFLLLPTSYYNIYSYILFPYYRPSVIANWPLEVLEIINRNILSSNQTCSRSPNTRFSPITRSPIPSSPLNPASNPIESITNIIEITSINSLLPLYIINTPGSHSCYSNIR
jgi:hypothetical protein